MALGVDEVAMLVKRGKDFLMNGDLASARLLLRRAAEAGSAEAALALGASFDPAVIRKLGAVGATPDLARARDWYQKAAQLGSQDASQRLAKLAQTPQ
jgi:TPR repeat protein